MQPDLDFFPQGMQLREHFLSPNQRHKDGRSTLFIDGNLDEEKLNQWMVESESGRLEEKLSVLLQSPYRWWSDNSFKFILGQTVTSPFPNGSAGSAVISGMATSWATPLATAMLLKMANEQNLDLKDAIDRKNLRSKIENRIFEMLPSN